MVRKIIYIILFAFIGVSLSAQTFNSKDLLAVPGGGADEDFLNTSGNAAGNNELGYHVGSILIGNSVPSTSELLEVRGSLWQNRVHPSTAASSLKITDTASPLSNEGIYLGTTTALGRITRFYTDAFSNGGILYNNPANDDQNKIIVTSSGVIIKAENTVSGDAAEISLNKSFADLQVVDPGVWATGFDFTGSEAKMFYQVVGSVAEGAFITRSDKTEMSYTPDGVSYNKITLDPIENLNIDIQNEIVFVNTPATDNTLTTALSLNGSGELRLTSNAGGGGGGSDGVISTLSFDTGTGDLTATRTVGGDIVENMDGRYLTAEAQTLNLSNTGILSISITGSSVALAPLLPNGLNLGAGQPIWVSVTGNPPNTMRFKTITAGSNITLTPSATELQISTTAAGTMTSWDIHDDANAQSIATTVSVTDGLQIDAENGLNVDASGDFGLGGDLNANTTIDMNTFWINFTDSPIMVIGDGNTFGLGEGLMVGDGNTAATLDGFMSGDSHSSAGLNIFMGGGHDVTVSGTNPTAINSKRGTVRDDMTCVNCRDVLTNAASAETVMISTDSTWMLTSPYNVLALGGFLQSDTVQGTQWTFMFNIGESYIQNVKNSNLSVYASQIDDVDSSFIHGSRMKVTDSYEVLALDCDDVTIDLINEGSHATHIKSDGLFIQDITDSYVGSFMAQDLTISGDNSSGAWDGSIAIGTQDFVMPAAKNTAFVPNIAIQCGTGLHADPASTADAVGVDGEIAYYQISGTWYLMVKVPGVGWLRTALSSW